MAHEQGDVHSPIGLDVHGITNVNSVYWNLHTSAL